ncbi:MAG: double zinc ribbon domain-containing protein [Spirochaetaceae bacterium]|nr:double zinc ribbon domain-containing protein [Spirochaetaceae bacterium]
MLSNDRSSDSGRPGILASLILDAFAPHYCIVCGRKIIRLEGAAGVPLCEDCLEELPAAPAHRCGICGKELFAEEGTCYSCRTTERSFDEVYSLYRYRDTPALLVRGYKMAKRHSLAGFWADRLEAVIRERWPDHVVVPVPPRPEKRKSREWDQVEAVAAQLGKRGICVRRVLLRLPNEEQKKLTREGRKSNAEKGYAFDPSCNEKAPSHVLLLDDIFTTGATAEACAKALRGKGSEDIVVLVLAMD